MKDPVCLMEIDLREAGAMRVHHGRAYYFCSTTCKKKFIDDPEQYQDIVKAERLSIGVMGSAGSNESNEAVVQARFLGETAGKRGLILITGACPGLPYESALGARSTGGLSVGISPALSLDEHIHKYESPSDAFDIIIYTGSGLMGREVTNIRSSDMVVIVGGRSGTLGEFSIAYDEGKLIGVLENSGGITDSLPDIVDRIDKDTGAKLVYESDPEKLVDKLITAYEEQHFRKPSCFCSTP
ncbi:MAG TPA: YHS domain-containing protein [Chromatiales bacterium]|nr:YHS domain-containing protein [Thiotrichales bacterium]HIP69022.1 YHS domain-containing protein [Chromatiales bacterium]